MKKIPVYKFYKHKYGDDTVGVQRKRIVPKSDNIVPNSLWLFGIFVVPLYP